MKSQQIIFPSSFLSVRKESYAQYLTKKTHTFSHELLHTENEKTPSDITVEAPPSVEVYSLFEKKSYDLFLQNLLLQSIKEEQSASFLWNSAFFSSGVFIYVPPQTAARIQILVHTLQPTVAKIILFVSRESTVHITQQYTQLSMPYLGSTHIVLEEKASVAHAVLAQTGATACTEHLQAHVGADSQWNGEVLLHGNSLSFDMRMLLSGENATAVAKCCPLAMGASAIRWSAVVHHQKRGTASTILAKAFIAGSSSLHSMSRACIDRAAEKSTSKQLIKGLLLDNAAKMTAQPELSVDCTDCTASHGSSIGQIDMQALNYLQARGFSKKEAMTQLITAFCTDVLCEHREKALQILAHEYRGVDV